MKKFFLYLLALIVLIQLIRPSKNSSEELSKNGIQTEVAISESIQSIIDRSCNDCHSNNTKYDWYHEIAPFSWVVAMHIKEGKEHVNFDEWKTYNKDQKQHIIEELEEVIETREMPLVGYLKFHPEAIISDEDNNELLDWIRTLEKE